jgi:hypothetical protein
MDVDDDIRFQLFISVFRNNRSSCAQQFARMQSD